MAMYPTHKKGDDTKTERQWNLLGYAVKEGAEGVKMWANHNRHGSPVTYYSESEVVEDDRPLKLIKAQKKAKAEFNRERKRALREWHTRGEWLEQGRIVDPDADTFYGQELNDIWFIRNVTPGSAESGKNFMPYSKFTAKIDCIYYHVDDTEVVQDEAELERLRKEFKELKKRIYDRLNESLYENKQRDSDV